MRARRKGLPVKAWPQIPTVPGRQSIPTVPGRPRRNDLSVKAIVVVAVVGAVMVAAFAALMRTPAKPPTTTTTTPPTTTTTTTTPVATPTEDLSKFNFEVPGDTQGWGPDPASFDKFVSVVQTTDEAKFGTGSLQCTVENVGAGPGSGSQFMLRARLEDVTGEYQNDLTGKTISVWVKFPPEARENDDPTAGIQAKMVLFWGEWVWLDSGDPPYCLECNGEWEQLTWDLSTVEGADLTQVVAVVLQFGEWGRSTPWNGTFWIDAYDWG